MSNPQIYRKSKKKHFFFVLVNKSRRIAEEQSNGNDENQQTDKEPEYHHLYCSQRYHRVFPLRSHDIILPFCPSCAANLMVHYYRTDRMINQLLANRNELPGNENK